jgi:hypothetical protein
MEGVPLGGETKLPLMPNERLTAIGSSGGLAIITLTTQVSSSLRDQSSSFEVTNEPFLDRERTDNWLPF